MVEFLIKSIRSKEVQRFHIIFFENGDGFFLMVIICEFCFMVDFKVSRKKCRVSIFFQRARCLHISQRIFWTVLVLISVS